MQGLSPNINMNRKINKVLLLGSGAIKIGEAGEFDYSGTQAIKALKEEGLRVILVNPNVATIQTSDSLADEVYFLPVTAEFVVRVIAKERPDGILLGFGGQTALNCGLELAKLGVLHKFGVEVLGTQIQAILETEDRKLFAEKLATIGLSTARGQIVASVGQGIKIAQQLGFPVMLRIGFALGGTSSGIAKTENELAGLLVTALVTTSQVIVEECLWDWKELEYEVVRDRADNCIAVCNMENLDPVGIHTGESIVVAPSQTLNNDEYYSLRAKSIAAIRAFGIVGECNIQFALHPKTGELRVIEINARLSRSSALASKATGYPLAYVAAKLALGKTLPELTNNITGKTSAFFEPALDYVVVKLPRWDLDKFSRVSHEIGSEMKSVGEVMSIARSFEEAIQKAARMLNDGYEGVIDPRFGNESKASLLKELKTPDPLRLFRICSALRSGITVKQIHEITGIDPWFLQKLVHIVEMSKKLNKYSSSLMKAKQLGFSDRQIALYTKSDEFTIRKKRINFGIKPFVERIDTLAGEFPALTNYLYLTYNAGANDNFQNQNITKKVIVLGCGPYAIGTSVEFDWCAVMTVNQLRKQGVQSVMINCNPETVSTDFDTSDILYFEELTLERVLDIYEIEKAPFILSVGGQTANNLAPKLGRLRVPILGTETCQIEKAENRQTFSKLLDQLNIPQPYWREVKSTKLARKMAESLGFPLLVRPSFVLSGKGMTVINNLSELDYYLSDLDVLWRDNPLVISKYFVRAQECDIDAVAQNGVILASVISEHIEDAGVHSGDSTMVLPADGIAEKVQKILSDYTQKIIEALKVNGPINIQYLIKNGEVFVIECNLRASRSFPFVSKVTEVNFIALATDAALGKKVAAVKIKSIKFHAVKAPQFSFHKLRGADPITGVEMNSTGEVVGFGRSREEAYLTAVLATGQIYPRPKSAALILGQFDSDSTLLESITVLAKFGFTFYSSPEMILPLVKLGINSAKICAITDGGNLTPLNLIKNKLINLLIVAPDEFPKNYNKYFKGLNQNYLLRRAAFDFGVALMVDPDLIKIYARAIEQYKTKQIVIRSSREWKMTFFDLDKKQKKSVAS